MPAPPAVISRARSSAGSTRRSAARSRTRASSRLGVAVMGSPGSLRRRAHRIACPGRAPEAREGAMSIRWSALAALVAASPALGCATDGKMEEMHHGATYTSDVSSVQVLSALIGGKNVFIPATIVVTDGGTRSLSIFNTTEMPHGFKIEGLGIETVIPPGQEV